MPKNKQQKFAEGCAGAATSSCVVGDECDRYDEIVMERITLCSISPRLCANHAAALMVDLDAKAIPYTFKEDGKAVLHG